MGDRLRHTTWLGVLFLGAATTAGQDPPMVLPDWPGKIKMQTPVITPDPDAPWGERVEDARRVFCSAAEALLRHFPPQDLPPILVEPRGGPIVLHRRGPNGEHLMCLNTGERYWAQHAFQFAHELTHILCRHEPYEHRNRWLEESICELGSLYALRRMAESWKADPPYPNWRDYAERLDEYAGQRLRAARLPPGVTLAAWYRENAESLAANAVQRKKNNVVAAALLPLFEQQPEHWAAVAYLNDGRPRPPQSLAEHLGQWHARTPAAHRRLVERIAASFEIRLAAPPRH